MGIGEKDWAGTGSTFSENVLKLDISGPGQHHFSVVDVPGIFRNVEQGRTSKNDIKMVEAMVRHNMENPRSVILAVIPANVDVATQGILTMAEDVDPEGIRTLGVLTKPDLVDRGAEPRVLDLLSGKKHVLKLGWCVVRNLNQKELDEKSEERNDAEKSFFLSQSPWNAIDKERAGIEALKVRMKELLAETIRRTFPSVKREISKLLKTAKEELTKLGAKRDSNDEQRAYLMEMAINFQEVVRLALAAQYGNHDCFEKHPNLRLATDMVTRNERFSLDMDQWGHTYTFDCDEFDLEPTVPYADDDEPNLVVRTQPDNADLEEVVLDHLKVDDLVKEHTLDWLMEEYQTSRGFRLGTFDNSLLSTTLKAQTVRWTSLALGYISDIITLAHNFFKLLLKLVCPDDRARNAILATLMDHPLCGYKGAYKLVEHLLRLERSGTPITLNHYFNDPLQKKREERMRENFSTQDIDIAGHGPMVRVGDAKAAQNMSNKEHTVRDLKDILESYYTVARKRFVDAVCLQAADFCIVTGPATPLKCFSPTFVTKLTPEQLEEIAGEDGAVRRRRRILVKEIGELEAGRKIVM